MAETIQRFEDLVAWQAARELVRGVYRAASSQKLRTDEPLKNQMKRAAVSIASNIAEGFERGTRVQHIEYCYMAKGSAGELRCQVILARDSGLLDDKACTWRFAQCERASRLIAGYLSHLKRTRERFAGMKFEETSEKISTRGHVKPLEK